MTTHVRISWAGEFDIGNTAQLSSLLDGLLAAEPPLVELNLESVDFLGFAPALTLVEFVRRARNSGCRCAVTRPSPAVRHTLHALQDLADDARFPDGWIDDGNSASPVAPVFARVFRRQSMGDATAQMYRRVRGRLGDNRSRRVWLQRRKRRHGS